MEIADLGKYDGGEGDEGIRMGSRWICRCTYLLLGEESVWLGQL